MNKKGYYPILFCHFMKEFAARCDAESDDDFRELVLQLASDLAYMCEQVSGSKNYTELNDVLVKIMYATPGDKVPY